jgi:hypothetical protein
MYYFNDTISIYTIGIGSIFNKLNVQRIDENTIKTIPVPLSYMGKLHYYFKKYKKFPDKYNIKSILPMMVFTFTGLEIDSSRMNGKFETLKFNNRVSAGISNWCRSAIPYKFKFTISIWTKYQTEMNQLLEQILAQYPQASRQLHIREIPVLNASRNCRITLEGISPDIQNEFEAENGDRVLMCDINLSLDGYLYPPIEQSELINEIDINLYIKMMSNNYKVEDVIVTEI